MRIVGLSGGIACGKSTVARLLADEHGVEVIDCDAIARATQRRGRWGHRRVAAAFGPRVLRAADGEIDREALGRLVFSDVNARRRLNAAAHAPIAVELVRRLLWAWLRLQPVAVVDMPLLFETGAHRWAALSVVVAADAGTQLRRLMARDGCGEADARARVDAQMPLEAKKARAGVVIDNGGGVSAEALRAQVAALAARLRPRGARWRALLTSPYALLLAAWAVRRLLAG